MFKAEKVGPHSGLELRRWAAKFRQRAAIVIDLGWVGDVFRDSATPRASRQQAVDHL